MVTIRLTRRGAANTPFYHVVVTDSRKRQGGKSLELVGFFNPRARGNDPTIRLDLPRIDHWLQEGAQQSDRVRALVKGYRVQQAAASSAPAPASTPGEATAAEAKSAKAAKGKSGSAKAKAKTAEPKGESAGA